MWVWPNTIKTGRGRGLSHEFGFGFVVIFWLVLSDFGINLLGFCCVDFRSEIAC